MPRPFKSGEKTGTVFNARRIANRLVAEAVVPQMLARSWTIAAALSGPIDTAIDAFFKLLSEFMGKSTDLADEIGGVVHWLPLSPIYIERKGTDAFWIYTMVANNVRKDRASIAMAMGVKNALNSKRVSKQLSIYQAGEQPLIQVFKSLSGLQAFGGCEVTINDRPTDLPGTTALGPFVKMQRESSAKVGSRQNDMTRSFEQRFNYIAAKVTIKIRLWSKFPKSGLSTIEQRLEVGGFFSQKTASKLLNRVGRRRPLVQPFMYFYSRVVIPNIIKQVIANNFSSSNSAGLNVSVSSNGLI